MPVTAPTAGGAQSAEAQPLRVPFIRATSRHFESAFDTTATVTGSTQNLGPFDVPSHGFIRNIVLYVEATGGAIGDTGVVDADFPFNILESVSITDTNGFPMVFPTSGYNLFLANLFGGYRGFNDPRDHPDYDAGAAVNPSFVLKIPVEITPWDGFGALSNQNQSAPFRVHVSLAASTTILSTVGDATLPSVRIRGYLEAYSPVADMDLVGNPQEKAPPGHGATQFWSVNTRNVSSGRLQIPHSRVGNLIRNLIYICRDSSGDRDATTEPDELTLNWDSRQVVVNLPNEVHRAQVFDTFGVAPPTGVLVFPFTDDQDGSGGYESRHMWMPTVQATRLELDATFGATGTIEILTNDVAVTAAGR